jgi:hypothetical protein
VRVLFVARGSGASGWLSTKSRQTFRTPGDPRRSSQNAAKKALDARELPVAAAAVAERIPMKSTETLRNLPR